MLECFYLVLTFCPCCEIMVRIGGWHRSCLFTQQPYTCETLRTDQQSSADNPKVSCMNEVAQAQVIHAFPWLKCTLIISLHVICLLYGIIIAICNWYVRVGIFLDVLQSTKFSHFLKLIGEKYLYSLIQKNFLKEICRIPICRET